MTNLHNPVLGITVGDINGIGLEVAIKTFLDNRMLNFCTPVFYASQPVVSYHKNTIKGANFNFQLIKSIKEVKHKRIQLINCWTEKVNIELGKGNPDLGEFALRSLSLAVDDLLSGKLDGIVTTPINKKVIQSRDFNFPGHTEFLMSSFKAPNALMLMVSGNLRIGVLSGHIPLSEVSSSISTEKVFSKIDLLHKVLQSDFCIQKPKIAVLGLNPHAGEDGLLGNEEIDFIIPAIEKAKENDILAFGPFPADGFFGTSMYNNFDAVLAMYHDQGLVPFKALYFNEGVNFTAGLPVVRTSPAHGTGYAIAGRDKADPTSFREAVYLACEVIKNKALYKELNENKLKQRMTKEKET